MCGFADFRKDFCRFFRILGKVYEDFWSDTLQVPTEGFAPIGTLLRPRNNKSSHIRTYFFEKEAEIGSYFKGTNTILKT